MLNQQIYDEASEWFMRMRDGEDSPAVRNELMSWLRRSPEHVSAYLDIAAIWMGTRQVTVDAQVDLSSRIAQARADIGIAELMSSRARPKVAAGGGDKQRVGFLRAHRAKGFAVAAALAVAMIGIHLYDQRDTYTTGVGEQHSVTLSDGSTVELNALTTVRTRFSKQQRSVELVEGQALFRVAKDPTRPFIVDSNGARVRAVGTEFDIYRKPQRTTITVIEGRVAVLSQDKKAQGAHPSKGEVLLSAGEQLRLERAIPPTNPVRVNVATATAWTNRQLVFEFTPLAEVAEEFNRYNTRRLVVEDPKLRALKITAMFRSTDPASLVRYIQTQPGVRVRETGDTLRIVSAAEGG